MKEALAINNTIIEESSIEKMVSKYVNDNGYTDSNKQIVRMINSNIQEMTINAFFENKDAFIKMEPNLEILYNYYSQQRNINYNRQRPVKIVDLISLFCVEPDETKIKQIKSGYAMLVKDLQTKNEKINMVIDRISSVKHYLVEKSISINAYDIPSVRKQDPQYSCDKFERQKSVDDNDMVHIIQEHCPDEYKMATKLFICPFCKSMFKEAAQGAYYYRIAQDDD